MEEVSLGLRPEESQTSGEVEHLGRRNGTCKGPEAGEWPVSPRRGHGGGVWFFSQGHWGATAAEGHDQVVSPSEGPRREGYLEAGEGAQARNSANGSSGRKFTSPVFLSCLRLVEQ